MRRHKYNAKPQIIDGIRFASKREGIYYMQLKALLRTKEISDLELQPKFKIPPDGYEFHDGSPAGGKICVYQADFRYKNKAGESVVVDTKGYKTREYRIKIKLMRYFWPSVDVIEA